MLSDQRPATLRGDLSDKLSVEERHAILAVCNSVRLGQSIVHANLAHRHAIYQSACDVHSERWRGATRNWRWIDQEQRNPDREMAMQIKEERIAA